MNEYNSSDGWYNPAYGYQGPRYANVTFIPPPMSEQQMIDEFRFGTNSASKTSQRQIIPIQQAKASTSATKNASVEDSSESCQVSSLVQSALNSSSDVQQMNLHSGPIISTSIPVSASNCDRTCLLPSSSSQSLRYLTKMMAAGSLESLGTNARFIRVVKPNLKVSGSFFYACNLCTDEKVEQCMCVKSTIEHFRGRRHLRNLQNEKLVRDRTLATSSTVFEKKLEQQPPSTPPNVENLNCIEPNLSKVELVVAEEAKCVETIEDGELLETSEEGELVETKLAEESQLASGGEGVKMEDGKNEKRPIVNGKVKITIPKPAATCKVKISEETEGFTKVSLVESITAAPKREEAKKIPEETEVPHVSMEGSSKLAKKNERKLEEKVVFSKSASGSGRNEVKEKEKILYSLPLSTEKSTPLDKCSSKSSVHPEKRDTLEEGSHQKFFGCNVCHMRGMSFSDQNLANHLSSKSHKTLKIFFDNGFLPAQPSCWSSNKKEPQIFRFIDKNGNLECMLCNEAIPDGKMLLLHQQSKKHSLKLTEKNLQTELPVVYVCDICDDTVGILGRFDFNKHYALREHLLKVYRKGNDDCPLFYGSVCNKGNSCPLRHSYVALFSDETCEDWRNGDCKYRDTCPKRHMNGIVKKPVEKVVDATLDDKRVSSSADAAKPEKDKDSSHNKKSNSGNADDSAIKQQSGPNSSKTSDSRNEVGEQRGREERDKNKREFDKRKDVESSSSKKTKESSMDNEKVDSLTRCKEADRSDGESSCKKTKNDRKESAKTSPDLKKMNETLTDSKQTKEKSAHSKLLATDSGRSDSTVKRNAVKDVDNLKHAKLGDEQFSFADLSKKLATLQENHAAATGKVDVTLEGGGLACSIVDLVKSLKTPEVSPQASMTASGQTMGSSQNEGSVFDTLAGLVSSSTAEYEDSSMDVILQAMLDKEMSAPGADDTRIVKVLLIRQLIDTRNQQRESQRKMDAMMKLVFQNQMSNGSSTPAHLLASLSNNSAHANQQAAGLNQAQVQRQAGLDLSSILANLNSSNRKDEENFRQMNVLNVLAANGLDPSMLPLLTAAFQMQQNVNQVQATSTAQQTLLENLSHLLPSQYNMDQISSGAQSRIFNEVLPSNFPFNNIRTLLPFQYPPALGEDVVSSTVGSVQDESRPNELSAFLASLLNSNTNSTLVDRQASAQEQTGVEQNSTFTARSTTTGAFGERNRGAPTGGKSREIERKRRKHSPIKFDRSPVKKKKSDKDESSAKHRRSPVGGKIQKTKVDASVHDSCVSVFYDDITFQDRVGDDDSFVVVGGDDSNEILMVETEVPSKPSPFERLGYFGHKKHVEAAMHVVDVEDAEVLSKPSPFERLGFLSKKKKRELKEQSKQAGAPEAETIVITVKNNLSQF